MKGYIQDIEKLTLENMKFRKVLYTAKHSQLVVMSLLPGEDIGNEVHPIDQFFRFEKGEGRVILNNDEIHKIKDGSGIIIPAGVWHNIINTSKDNSLKLYTVYSPPHHKDKVSHATKEIAEKDDEEFDGKTTE